MTKHEFVHANINPISASEILQLVYDEALKVLEHQIDLLNKHIFNNFLQRSVSNLLLLFFLVIFHLF